MFEVSNRRWVWPAALTSLAFAMGACASEDGLGSSSQHVAVTWTNVVGATATGNDLVKTAANGWGNSGAVSVESVSGDAFVEFTTAEANAGKAAGLSTGDSSQSYTDIDFAFLLAGNGQYQVYEAGVAITPNLGAYAAGDVFRVESVERVVRYYRNGALVHTSTKMPTYPLLVDTALFHTNATIENVDLTDYQFTNMVGVTQNGNDLTKTLAGNAWNTAGAISVRTIKADDGFVQFTTAENGLGKIAGLSSTDTNQSFNTIRYGILLGGNQAVQVYESGALRGTFGTYAANDTFRVEIVDGVVNYLHNGAVFYTSAVAPVYPLFADTAFFHSGATLNDIVVEDTFFTSVSSADAIGNKIFGLAATNSGAITVDSFVGNGFVEFGATNTNTGKAMGLNAANAANTLADIDFAILLAANGSVEVVESGVSRGSFGAYATTDVYRVDVTAGVVTYQRNGTTFYTSTLAPTYPLFGDAALLASGAVLTNVAIAGGNADLVPRDPTSGYAVPLTQDEWNIVFDVAGVARKTVNQSWSLQDASGNAAATIGSPLTASAGLDYLQAVPGWTRMAIAFGPDGGGEFLKQTRVVGPDPTQTSVLSFVYAGIEAPAVGATRRMLVIGGQAQNEALLGITNVGGVTTYRLVCDGVATLGTSTTAAGPVRPLFLQYDRTAAQIRAYTDQEIITGTYSTGVTSSTKGLGTADNAGTSGAQQNLLAATFVGADAEWTEAEMRAVYNVLINGVVPW